MKAFILAVAFASISIADPPSAVRLVRNGEVQPYIDGKTAVDVVGMSAISGPSEHWLIELHDSFASLEDLDKALGAVDPRAASAVPQASDGILPPYKSLIAIYRPALSYRPDQAIQIFPKMRYMDAVMCRIRPGTEADFVKLAKLRAFGLDSINLDRPEVAYQVISGAPSGTYVFLSPLPSLRFLDDGRPFTPAYAEGAEATARKMAADTELVREHLWFRIEPQSSYVSERFASSDSAFWHPTGK
jgi:hypothetical protein